VSKGGELLGTASFSTTSSGTIIPPPSIFAAPIEAREFRLGAVSALSKLAGQHPQRNRKGDLHHVPEAMD